MTHSRKLERLFEDFNRKASGENRERPEHGWKHGDRRGGLIRKAFL